MLVGKGRDGRVVGVGRKARGWTPWEKGGNGSGVSGPARPDTPGVTKVTVYLVEEVKKGNQLLAAIKQHLRRALRCDARAADILQQVFLNVIRQQSTFRGDSFDAFEAWFATILEGTVQSESRRAMRRRRRLRCVPLDKVMAGDSTKENWREPLSSWLEPHEQCIQGEEGHRILDEIATLPRGLGRVFVDRVLGGQSIPEIAAALGITAECVSSRLAQAKCRLRPKLKRAGIGPG